MQNKEHICESFSSLNNIYGSGRNSSFVTQELIMSFLCSPKDKSSKLQCHLEQDKQQLRPSHIISINYLDLDKAYASHKFQVQSKFLYQNSLIQNSGEFKTENQVLERNYDRASSHHFHSKRLSSESFYLTPKLQTNTFYFVSPFLRSSLIYS